MRRTHRAWKILGYTLAAFLLLLVSVFFYLSWVSRVSPPAVADFKSLQWGTTEPSRGFYTLKNNWFRKSKSGLYELYVEGEPFERGVVNGKLTKELIAKQEDYFNQQINRLIPSKFYLHFLKYVVGWFNRNLDRNITQEYKQEIYGVSESASEKYQYIGSNYQRILNYHAAHDIGHALQNLALVGCTSFGTWDGDSEDSTMIIGRNFDFYVGDQFSENKIIVFERPSQGYKFMSVSWAGFIGVVSGMNEKGLTVTINAAKSSVPSGSATPVSLVAREILQYAQNIAEAVAIARKRTMFVSESFLIGSAQDDKAVIIEKTPDSLDVYDPHKHFIICTNHFQSQRLGNSRANLQQMQQSASVYRYERLSELLQAGGRNTVQKTVNILRDRRGLQDSDIGLGNEKAINQLIAHHAIVFEPQKLRVWVSTAPWQLGEFVAYDLHQVFALQGMTQDKEVSDSSLNIAPDTFVLSAQFRNFQAFRSLRLKMENGEQVDPDSLVQYNPEFYRSYVLAGDYRFKQKAFNQAMHDYQLALTKVIATQTELDYIHRQIKKCAKRLEQ
jgi:isopenicillin-N N-acyltransferase like protein